MHPNIKMPYQATKFKSVIGEIKDMISFENRLSKEELMINSRN